MSKPAQTLHQPPQVQQHLQHWAQDIATNCSSDKPIHLVGIHTRGVHLAQRLQPLLLEHQLQLGSTGSLDIALYRDDIQGRGLPQLRDTELNFDMNQARVLLIDDVLYTGRTIRSALQALSEYGRPEWIKLAIYADRGHRQLPIQPDFAACQIQTTADQHLTLQLSETDDSDQLILQ